MKNIAPVYLFSFLLVCGCAGEAPKTPEPAAAPTAETPDPQPESVPIEPPVGAWRLIAFGDATEVSDPEVTLQVEQDGTFTGTSGCNRYSARWKRTDVGMSLGPVASTKKMCPADVMEIEDRFLTQLKKTAGWRPHVDGIVLADAAGDPLLVFERLP